MRVASLNDVISTDKVRFVLARRDNEKQFLSESEDPVSRRLADRAGIVVTNAAKLGTRTSQINKAEMERAINIR